VYLTFSPTHNELKEYYLRGAGIHCRRNENAIDHLIPIWNGSYFSYILVSVKNQQKRHSGWNNTDETCTPWVCGLETSEHVLPHPTMVLLMGVNVELKHDAKIEIHSKFMPRTNRITPHSNVRTIFEIGSFGLSNYVFLKGHSNLMNHFQNLAITFPDPLKIIQSQKMAPSVAKEVVETLLCVNYRGRVLFCHGRRLYIRN
jgi:hypothetical protein